MLTVMIIITISVMTGAFIGNLVGNWMEVSANNVLPMIMGALIGGLVGLSVNIWVDDNHRSEMDREYVAKYDADEAKYLAQEIDAGQYASLESWKGKDPSIDAAIAKATRDGKVTNGENGEINDVISAYQLATNRAKLVGATHK